MSKNLNLIKTYIPIANFIAKVNGENCEVILHDLSDIDHSIVYIVNSYISGRSIGGSITKYALDLIMKYDDSEHNHYVNYIGKNEKTGKLMRSSTLFIRDENSQTVGLLCVNIDVTDFVKLRDQLNEVIQFNVNQFESVPNEPERFDLSTEEIINEIINTVFLDSNYNSLTSSKSEKKEITKMLYQRGLFKFKGAVYIASTRLDVSQQTLYRYIKEIETE